MEINFRALKLDIVTLKMIHSDFAERLNDNMKWKLDKYWILFFVAQPEESFAATRTWQWYVISFQQNFSMT